MSNNTSLLSVWPVLLQLQAFGNCELLAGATLQLQVASAQVVFPALSFLVFTILTLLQVVFAQVLFVQVFCTGFCTGGVCDRVFLSFSKF